MGDVGMKELEGHEWVCPCCKGELESLGDALYCGVCERRYENLLGIPDFRLGFQESENQVALAREFHAHWNEMTWLIRHVGSRQDTLEAWKMFKPSFEEPFQEFLDAELAASEPLY